MKRLSTLLVAFGLLAHTPVQAQTGLEGLLGKLIVPAISSVLNTVQKVAFSITDFAAVFADADTFIKQNAENLALDISRGNGEYLTALADLVEIPEAKRADWYKDLQTRYATAKKG